MAQRVTDAPNDKEQLVPTVEAIAQAAGSVESLLGFRRFMLRGLAKAKLEWTLVSTAYNLKRLHRMVGTV